MQRRQFLLALASAPLYGPALATPAAPPIRYLSARADAAGQHHLTAFEASGQLLFDLPLPGRGHGIALHPHRPWAVQVARRPGRYLLVVDLEQGRQLHALASRPDRLFQGHGLFSADGRYLFTTESDIEHGRGYLGVRDTQQAFQQVAEWSIAGVEPHDLRLIEGGATLVVADGGMRTHPDAERTVLNLDTMEPALIYLSASDGRLLERVTLAPNLHQNSIRHLAVAADDTICCVMQFQGSKREQPPLVALHRRGGAIQLLAAPAEIQGRMRNYCGSAATDSSGTLFAVTSPRGGITTFWRAADGAYLGHAELADGCGAAAGPQPGQFLVSSGLGGVVQVTPGQPPERVTALDPLAAHWDNHMARSAV